MKAINKNQQKSTFLQGETINQENGLTPKQERAAMFLVSGRTITDVSKELNIDRGTLYKWFEKITFKAFYYKCCEEVKSTVTNKMLGLYDESLKALESSLKSKNESIKLKAAIWLIERIESLHLEETDPKIILHQQCVEDNFKYNDWGSTFNTEKYNRLCKENGLIP